MLLRGGGGAGVLRCCPPRSPATRLHGTPSPPARLNTTAPLNAPARPAQALELEPGNGAAAAAVKRLTPVVEERREKLKQEMMGARAGAAGMWWVGGCALVGGGTVVHCARKPRELGTLPALR